MEINGFRLVRINECREVVELGANSLTSSRVKARMQWISFTTFCMVTFYSAHLTKLNKINAKLDKVFLIKHDN